MPLALDKPLSRNQIANAPKGTYAGLSGLLLFWKPTYLENGFDGKPFDPTISTSSGRLLGALMTGIGFYYFLAGIKQDRNFQQMSVYGRLIFAGMGLYGIRKGWIHPAWKMGLITDVFGAGLTQWALNRQS